MKLLLLLLISNFVYLITIFFVGIAMPNPSGLPPNYPSASKFAPTMQSGNPLSSNGVQLPNDLNPKSFSSPLNGANPSGNGMSVGFKKPIYYQAPTTTPKVPVANPTQTVQTTSTPVVSNLQAGALSLAAGYVGATVGSTAGRAIGGDVGSAYGEALGSAAAAAAIGYATGNPAAAAVGAALTATSSLANSAVDALGKLAQANLGEKQAKKTLDDANKRYDKALQNQQSANPANSKGSGINTGDGSYTPPFTGGQSAGIYYIISGRAQFDKPNGSNEGGNIASPPVLSPIKRVYTENVNGSSFWKVESGSEITTVIGVGNPNDWVSSWQNIVITRSDGSPDTGGDVPNPNPSPKTYEPPKDFYKDRESTDPNNPKSPNYFPYFPVVQISDKAAKAYAPAPVDTKERKDERPYKEPEKPVYAPPVAPSPTPTPSPSSNPDPTFSSPDISRPNSATSANTNSGTSQPYVSPSVDGGVFTPRPYESGKSDPSEYGNPKDIATGLTRDEFEKAKQAKQNEGATRAAAFDAKVIEEQLRNLPNTVRNGESKSAQQTQREQYERSIANDPIRLAAYQQAQSKAFINVPKPVTTPTTTPTTNPNPSIDLGTIATTLGAIGLAVTAIGQRATKIDNQTTPSAQQTNAKQGVCDAMQPQQCGFEGVKQATTEATNPIKDIANDNKGVLAAILANLLTLGKLIVDNFTKLFKFLDINAKVEAVKSTITLALTLHNALMLSQNLGTTLGAIIDNVLGTFGQTFKTTEGSTVTASEFLGASVKQWIINVIGLDNYLKLNETFALANRIYQAGINVLSTVQSILDSAASVAQATGINVAKIGNALRDDGTISPKAYTHMDDSKAGNRPTTLGRFEQLTTTISDFDTKAQNLVTVTAAPIQIKEAVKQSKEDIKAFNDARDVNSDANKAAKEAKLDEIKALKAITEATVSKKDDDT